MQSQSHITKRILHAALMLLFALSFAATPGATGSSTASIALAQKTPLDVPVVIVDEIVNEYAITNGLIYWAYAGDAGEFGVDGYLRRMPSHGGATLTLQTTSASLDSWTFWWLNADDTGVYYVNYYANTLDFRPTDDPTHAQTLFTFGTTNHPVAQLELDEDYIYWAAENNHIYRLPKSGGSAVSLHTSAAGGVTDIEQWGSWLTWLDAEGLWQCTKPDCLDITHPSTHTGNRLKSYFLYLFWVENTLPQKIHWRACFIGCIEDDLYTAPAANWTINRPAVGECPDGNVCVFWEEYETGIPHSGRIRRVPISGGTPDILADNLFLGNNPVETDDQGVYFFLLDQSLGRLPFSATEVQRNLRAYAWEVTQGVQSLENDVPLVAHKPTYVRLYPTHTGDPANFVQAWLEGEKDGSPLPDSPLEPLNGPFAIDDAYMFDREQTNGGYLFQLPDSWTEAGTITLRGVVDPRQIYADTDPSNNILEGDFTFVAKPPVCDIFIPVRTHTPPASVEAPNFWRMIDLHRRLWPVPDVQVYHQTDDVAEPQVCWWGPFPYPCSGPFELNEGTSWSDWVKDDEEALLHIGTRAAFSDDPDECDDMGSAVHYIGMIHPNAPWGWGGLAYVEDWLQPASLVYLPPHDADPPDDWNWPWEGSTLAHETSHNHERKHVDCGNPADPDGSFPYPVCELDDATDPTHFGFDVNQRVPILPENASDYMSYSGRGQSATWQGRWVTDYTYRAMFGRFSALEQLLASANPSSLALAASNVLISASVDPAANEGVLNPAWVFPTTALSQGILEKWQALNAPAFDAATLSAAAPTYHVRLLDSGGATLADYTLTPLSTEVHEDEARNLAFLGTFAAPTGEVARLDLMSDSTILSSLTPGSQVPVVSIQQPAGGEVYTNSMTISWQASDPDVGDHLLFNLQYSPDAGLTWKSIATNLPAAIEGDTNILELDDLGGLGASDGPNGLIRVAATDGYHTVLAESNPFTVENQPPQTYILSPLSTQIYPATESVPLRGGASDPEQGAITGSKLSWKIDGNSWGNGAENSAEGLAPGTHTVTLKATDAEGSSDSASALLTISRLEIPLDSPAPTLDGLCDEAAYTGPTLKLAPYSSSESGQASVKLLRTANALWACFGGMPRSDTALYGFVALRVDVNNSRDELAQTDDYAFFIFEDGTPLTRAGNGSGGFNLDGPGGLLAQVSASDEFWFAEMKIDSSVLGGWDHPIGLDAEYTLFVQRNPWPYTAVANAPNTWGWTVLGTLPEITQLSPEQATAGGAAFNLTLNGENFQDGATAYWMTTALPTTYISPTQLTAQVDAGLISSAKFALITVVNPDALTSNPAIFTVVNPLPVISSINPPGVIAGASSLTLSVSGSGFVDGSQVVWDGEALPTTYLDASHLEVTLDAEMLRYAGEVGVVVHNPDPSGGISNSKVFNIHPRGRVLLPLIERR